MPNPRRRPTASGVREGRSIARMPPFRRRLSLLGYSHIRPTPQGENHSLCFLYHASLFLCCLDFWVCPSLSVQPNRKPTDKNRKSLAKNRPNGKRPKRRRQIAYSSRGRPRCGSGERTTRRRYILRKEFGRIDGGPPQGHLRQSRHTVSSTARKSPAARMAGAGRGGRAEASSRGKTSCSRRWSTRAVRPASS